MRARWDSNPRSKALQALALATLPRTLDYEMGLEGLSNPKEIFSFPEGYLNPRYPA